MIHYRCPKCGGEMMLSYLTSNPPTEEYWCLKCGFKKHIKVEDPEVWIDIPDDESNEVKNE